MNCTAQQTLLFPSGLIPTINPTKHPTQTASQQSSNQLTNQAPNQLTSQTFNQSVNQTTNQLLYPTKTENNKQVSPKPNTKGNSNQPHMQSHPTHGDPEVSHKYAKVTKQ